jgi:hypothetical protein
LNDINTKDFETGVEEDVTNLPHGPVLSDRLTQHYVKGSDHPTFFAKGTEINDTTTGGKFIGSSSDSSSSNNATKEQEGEKLPVPIVEQEEYFEAPAGWKFEKVTEQDPLIAYHPVAGRKIGDDSDLDFIPREEFYGRREGYCFRLGSKGVGYYEDKGQKMEQKDDKQES